MKIQTAIKREINSKKEEATMTNPESIRETEKRSPLKKEVGTKLLNSSLIYEVSSLQKKEKTL